MQYRRREKNINANINIENIEVSNNTAAGKGGGLYLGVNSLYYASNRGKILSRKNTIKYSTIKNNSAEYGGGIYLTEIGADIENTKILNNTYTAQGGGIFATIDKQFPDGNTNDVKLVNSEIKNNKIKEGSTGDNLNGGGAYISTGNIVTNNSKIEANEAQYGGGVYLADNSKLKSSSSSFKNNKASQDGGAIFTELHSYGKDGRDKLYKYPPLPDEHYTNIEVDENSEFDGNTARKFFKEPYNYEEFSKIKSKNQSAPEGEDARHIINNYDVNFRVYPRIRFNKNIPGNPNNYLFKPIITLEEGEELKEDQFATLGYERNRIFIGWSFDKDAKPTDTDKLIKGDNPIFRQKLIKDGKEIDTDDITIYAIWQTKTKVSYTYVSDDPTVDLPAEILESKPMDQEIEFGKTIDPNESIDPKTIIIKDESGRKVKWTLSELDPNSEIKISDQNHKDGLEITATWSHEYADTAVKFEFKADDGSELPEDVKKLKPKDKNYDFGAEVDPETLVTTKEVVAEKDGRKGKWVLENWNPEKTTLDEEKHKDGLTFKATWKFEYTDTIVKVEFESNDGSDLPDDVKNLKPEDKNYDFGAEVDPETLVTTKEVAAEKDGRKGKWVLENWNPEKTTLDKEIHKDGLTFKATWKFVEDNIKPNPDPDKPNPDPDKPNPDPDKPNPDPDKPNPDSDKPNPDPDKPNPDSDKPNPDPDKPNPNPDKPNPNLPNTPDRPGEDKPSIPNIEEQDNQLVGGRKIVKTTNTSNPKTGVESVTPILTSLGLSIAGILSMKKKEENDK